MQVVLMHTSQRKGSCELTVCTYEIAQVGSEFVTYAITDATDRIDAGILGCVFEIDTDGDMSIVNPYTSKRLWVGCALNQAPDIYEAMARVLEVAKELNFLGDPEQD